MPLRVAWGSHVRLLWLLGFAFVLVTVHVGAMALTAALLGLAPREVRFFFGPRWLLRRLGDTELQLAVLPLGGFVTFHAPPLERSAPRALLLSLSGPAALVLFGVALGADALAWVRSSPEWPSLLWNSEQATAVARELLTLVTAAPARALGWLSLLFATLNLLPWRPFNGGDALEALLSTLARRTVRLPAWSSAVGLLAGALLMVRALLAVVRAW